MYDIRLLKMCGSTYCHAITHLAGASGNLALSTFWSLLGLMVEPRGRLPNSAGMSSACLQINACSRDMELMANEAMNEGQGLYIFCNAHSVCAQKASHCNSCGRGRLVRRLSCSALI